VPAYSSNETVKCNQFTQKDYLYILQKGVFCFVKKRIKRLYAYTLNPAVGFFKSIAVNARFFYVQLKIIIHASGQTSRQVPILI
jgi:hypothetical protein